MEKIEKAHIDTGEILVNLIKKIENEVAHHMFTYKSKDGYFLAIRALSILPNDFVKENSYIRESIRKIYSKALNFFVYSMPPAEIREDDSVINGGIVLSSLDLTEGYICGILNIVKIAKRQLDLSLCREYSIEGLEELTQKFDGIHEDAKFDNYEKAHFGYVIDWGDYKEREKAINKSLEIILDGIKTEIKNIHY